VFSGTNVADLVAEPRFRVPATLFVGALAVDLLQYISGTVTWGWFGRTVELRQIGEEDTFKAPRWINWHTNTLFGLKLLLVAVGYRLLLAHLLAKLLPRG
jgi:hypothetical protein